MNNQGGFIRRLTEVYDNETSLQTTRYAPQLLQSCRMEASVYYGGEIS
jgi:hypothetical protein